MLLGITLRFILSFSLEKVQAELKHQKNIHGVLTLGYCKNLFWRQIILLQPIKRFFSTGYLTIGYWLLSELVRRKCCGALVPTLGEESLLELLDCPWYWWSSTGASVSGLIGA